jgi:cytochrome c biogenesis protein CcmG/thiol:disulfide interchange protein DsbE
MSDILRGHASRAFVLAIAAAVLALIGVLAVAMLRGVGDSPLGRADAPFARAADFTLPTLDGSSSFVLADHTNGPLFIYFWASWCRPCEQEAPLIQKLWPEYQKLGYTFVGINVQDAQRDAKDFVARHGLGFPVLRDVEGKVYLDYGVFGLPEAFFIRPGQVVTEKYNGPLDERDFRAMLARLQGAS